MCSCKIDIAFKLRLIQRVLHMLHLMRYILHLSAKRVVSIIIGGNGWGRAYLWKLLRLNITAILTITNAVHIFACCLDMLRLTLVIQSWLLMRNSLKLRWGFALLSKYLLIRGLLLLNLIFIHSNKCRLLDRGLFVLEKLMMQMLVLLLLMLVLMTMLVGVLPLVVDALSKVCCRLMMLVDCLWLGVIVAIIVVCWSRSWCCCLLFV